MIHKARRATQRPAVGKNYFAAVIGDAIALTGGRELQ
jgi:hypothetical protein